jgi:hypothetical protein
MPNLLFPNELVFSSVGSTYGRRPPLKGAVPDIDIEILK